jgi:hypothetical protein
VAAGLSEWEQDEALEVVSGTVLPLSAIFFTKILYASHQMATLGNTWIAQY